MSQRVIDKHYRRLAENYDKYLHYSHDFVRTLTRKMVTMLDLRPEDRFVDLGGGTGIYTVDIIAQVPSEHRVTLVDPFPEMLDKVPEEAPIDRVAMDGLRFAEHPATYDKVLIKEAVHHINDRPRLFAALFERLAPGGALLLVHVPPDIDYPLFEAALERSLEWHADPDELEQQLMLAGFDVRREGLDYRHEMPKEHYFDMVRTSYMSLLTSFSDEEREAGLCEMERKYADTDTLRFNDHFDYILGQKAA